MRALVLILLFPLCLPAQKADTLSSEDLKIIVTVIRQVDNFGNKEVVLIDSSNHEQWFHAIDANGFITTSVLKKNSKVCSEIIDGYRALSKDTFIIGSSQVPDSSVFIVTKKEMLSKSWVDFVKDYPKADGYYSSSPVYHSKDGKYAALSLARECGMECGEGRNIIAELVDGKWKVIYSSITWVE